MNRVFFNIIILASLFLFQVQQTLAAPQTMTVNIPAVNNVSVTGGNLSSNIDPISGALYSEINSIFSVSTNNKNGLIADFSVKVDTLSGQYNASIGQVSGSNSGMCVMTNSDFKPDSNSVANALGNSANSTSNPNVIGFKISYINQNSNGDNPVFAANSGIASGEVLHKKGTTTVIARIQNNSDFNAKTYNNTSDSAGSYQLTIYCTVYNP